MAKSCAIIPQVFNKEGEIVDSKLFKDLLSFTNNNRELTKKIYGITQNPIFKEKFPKVQYDDNDEPLLSSMYQHTDLNKFISDEMMLKKLNKDMGGITKDGAVQYHKHTKEVFQDLSMKVANFNESSEFKKDFVAKVTPAEKDEKSYYTVKVEKRDSDNTQEAMQADYNFRLNKALEDILQRWGISVGALTELEERMEINGVADFSVAKNAATGLIEMIRLAQGERGQQALPEEFAHCALRMLQDHPLVRRLVNYLHTNDLVSTILGETFEEYVDMYDGNAAKLAEEAAGKLLAKHLLQAMPIEKKPYKGLLGRAIDTVKSFFKKLNANEIQKAMIDADAKFGRLAKELLKGSLDNEIKTPKLTNDKLYQVEQKISREQALLKKVLQNEIKRLKIYERRNPGSKFVDKQNKVIDDIEMSLALKDEINGIYNFLGEAVSTMQSLKKRLDDVLADPTSNLKSNASTLRDIKNYLFSYSRIAEDITKEAAAALREGDDRFTNTLRARLAEIQNLHTMLYDDLITAGRPLFLSYIKPFIGEEIVVPFGKHKGETITLAKLLEDAEGDVGFIDLWLNSASDSPDIFIQVLDQAIKQAKDRARLDTIEIQKKIEAAGLKLEKAGITDHEWMFERDREGKRTGRYISAIDYAGYEAARDAKVKELDAKYGNLNDYLSKQLWNAEYQKWLRENAVRELDGTYTPNPEVWINKDFPEEGTPKREFYDTVMGLKKELDLLLPEKATSNLRTIKIRKDLVERVKDAESVGDGGKQIGTFIKDLFMRRSDDTEFGDQKKVLKDFEGREVMTLPIYYTTVRDGESEDDMSTDVVTTMIAYASMANDFYEMNEVLDILEVGRDVMREREIHQGEGGKKLKEKFKAFGWEIDSTVVKKGDETNFMKRVNKLFEMHVYQRYMKDEGTFGESQFDKAKTANTIIGITALQKLGFNALSGISNVATGNHMMMVEAISKQYFTARDVLAADKMYGRALLDMAGELGKRVKTNKLSLFSELFNVGLEYENQIKNVDFNKRSIISRIFKYETVFFLNTCGEHWMTNRTALALANQFIMKGPNGEETNLWNALEVSYLQDDGTYGPNKTDLGARLQIKEGYTKEDGTEFTKNDIYAFSEKVGNINRHMHGMYDKASMNAIQQVALGRMAAQFRKYLIPSMNKRFQRMSYDVSMQNWREGYYRTYTRFIGTLIKDLRNGELNYAKLKEDLDPVELANIRRARTEAAFFALLLSAITFIDWGDDKTKKRPWALRMLEYQTRRLYTEVGAMVPSHAFFTEGLKMLKSPAASIQTMEGTIGLLKALSPWNWTDEIQSGRFKGHSTAYRAIMKSPLIPFKETVYRGINPEELIPFYKQ